MKFYKYFTTAILILGLLTAFPNKGLAVTGQYKQLLLSGSKLMNVNGSGGATKTFSYSPGTGTVRVKYISAIVQDEGASEFNKFSTLAALTNGVQMQWVKGGVTTTYATIKDNADLTNVFPDSQHFGNSAVLSLLSIVTPQGFGNTNNVFRGKVDLGNENFMTDSDSFQAVVQDNLTTISFFQMAILVESD